MKEKDRHNDLYRLGEMADSLHETPFVVPDQYFETLHSRTLQRCRHIELSADVPVPSPEYFEQLEDRILGRIAEQKLKEVVRTPGFTVPADYFDTLPGVILDRVANDKPAPVVSKVRKLNWLKYAAAACVLFATGIFGYFSTVNQAGAQHLDAVSDQEILSYLEFYGEPADITYITEYLDDEQVSSFELHELSEDDIEAYLNNTL